MCHQILGLRIFAEGVYIWRLGVWDFICMIKFTVAIRAKFCCLCLHLLIHPRIMKHLPLLFLFAIKDRNWKIMNLQLCSVQATKMVSTVFFYASLKVMHALANAIGKWMMQLWWFISGLHHYSRSFHHPPLFLVSFRIIHE